MLVGFWIDGSWQSWKEINIIFDLNIVAPFFHHILLLCKASITWIMVEHVVVCSLFLMLNKSMGAIHWSKSLPPPLYFQYLCAHWQNTTKCLLDCSCLGLFQDYFCLLFTNMETGEVLLNWLSGGMEYKENGEEQKVEHKSKMDGYTSYLANEDISKWDLIYSWPWDGWNFAFFCGTK